jgi:hypothetical protein
MSDSPYTYENEGSVLSLKIGYGLWARERSSNVTNTSKWTKRHIALNTGILHFATQYSAAFPSHSDTDCEE